MALPELSAPAECYYNELRSKEYNRNSRIAKIQADITARAIELMGIDEKSLVLDLGCGSGLSGQVLAEYGHSWLGIDISQDMLSLAKDVPGCQGLINSDLGCRLPFVDESFDYAISISAVQWLLHSYRTEHIPVQRIRTFFRSLYSVVVKKAVIQFYCSRKGQSILLREAKNAGFYGGMVIDSENTKNEKRFLVLEKCKPRKGPAKR